MPRGGGELGSDHKVNICEPRNVVRTDKPNGADRLEPKGECVVVGLPDSHYADKYASVLKRDLSDLYGYQHGTK